MSFSGMTTMDEGTVAIAQRARGRRRTSTIQRERDKHVQAAVLLYIKRLHVSIVMAALNCSRSTAYLWADRAVDYPEYAAACREALAG